jgi:hypothetical protein
LSDYKSKSCCVSDNGLYSELALKLSQSFGKVFYTAPWIDDFPNSYRVKLGEGFTEFERVDDVLEVVDDVDLFVFPDSNQGILQTHLADLGKRVWGSRMGDELELYREDSRAYFDSLGILQPPYEVVKGMTALRKYIKGRGMDKLWIKISFTRGDTETFSVEGYELSKNHLDELEAKLGPMAEFRSFVVEENLPGTYDLAIDTYCIDGKFPKKGLLGNEQKDQGYIGVVQDWTQFPKTIRDNYEKMSPAMKGYGYRNFFAVEHRIAKDKQYFSDPALRVGSPIFELELEMIANLSEILWEGADGKLVEPDYKAKYGYEILVQSSWAARHPLLVEFPEKYKDHIKLRYASQFPDGLWILPQKQSPIPDGSVAFGAIVTYGASIDDCVEEAAEIAAQIKGEKVDCFTGSATALKENLEEMSSWGIKF